MSQSDLHAAAGAHPPANDNLTRRLKPHREFFSILAGADPARWTPVAVTQGRVEEIILADNLDIARNVGSRTRLVRWSPGALIEAPVVHDFHEEVFIFEGDFTVGCDAAGTGGETFGPLTYACRPPGALHGPFTSRSGCMMLEFMYYGTR